MRVFVAEKPSVAEAIAKQISPHARRTDHFWDCGDDKVTWCYGHLLETAAPEDYDPKYKSWKIQDLPVVPEKWQLKPVGKHAPHLNQLKKLFQSADVIVNAGDPDREGQLVVDEILRYFSIRKSIMRLWLNAIDPASVKKALQGLESNSKYESFMETALGRQRADWLIGMNLTRFFTEMWKAKGGESLVLSVGRVQTPTLALIVTRDREIAAFKSHDYYNLQFVFRSLNGEQLQVKWVKDRAVQNEPPGRRDSDGRIIQRPYVDDLAQQLNGAEAIVEDSVGEAKAEHAPLPFSLSELQKIANKAYGYSPKEVLTTCQALYEQYTLTTYPRTDCGYLKESQHAEAPEVVAAVKSNLGNALAWPDKLDLSAKSKAWNDKKVTAHHGIIPTSCTANLDTLSDREKNVYVLIVKRYLAQFLPAHEYITTKITVVAGTHQLEATAKVVTRMGWRVLEGREEGEEDTVAADVADGDLGRLIEPQVKRQATKPPERFTGATLIDAMKNAHRFVKDDEVKNRLKDSEGIGTEATRADIIDGLLIRDYVEMHKSGKKTEYRATVLGDMLISFLPSLFTSPELTAFLEKKLSEIEARKTTLAHLETLIVRMLVATIEDGKEGIGLENLNPALLPAHFQQALAEKKAKSKEKRQARADGKAKSQRPYPKQAAGKS